MDERLIPLSALQHYVFCPRQCALIHNEQVWAENFLTAQGQLLHERVDHGLPESRKGIRYERGVDVSAPLLGITGKLDLLEYHKSSQIYLPIEYKRGKAKPDNSDKVQLCAQALCIEEMMETQVSQGALWYWQTRKRLIVELDKELRQQTKQIITEVKILFQQGITPKAQMTKACKACSLVDLCQPELLEKDKSHCYIKSLFKVK